MPKRDWWLLRSRDNTLCQVLIVPRTPTKHVRFPTKHRFLYFHLGKRSNRLGIIQSWSKNEGFVVSTPSVKCLWNTQTSCQSGQVRLLSLFSHLASAAASSAAPSFIPTLPLKHVYKVRSGRSNNNWKQSRCVSCSHQSSSDQSLSPGPEPPSRRPRWRTGTQPPRNAG